MRKLSHNSITLLVAGCVSVAIERAFIPQDWEYNQHVSTAALAALAAAMLGSTQVETVRHTVLGICCATQALCTMLTRFRPAAAICVLLSTLLQLRCWVPGADFSRAISRGDLMTCMVMT